MPYRRTLKREVGCTGIGLHTGRPVQLLLKPASAESGIRFFRKDVGVEIPASLESLAYFDHATTLQRQGVSISTVEHVLSALHALGVDDALVEVNGPEVPILDGSAAPFVILLHEAGLRPLPIVRQYLKVLEPVEIVRGTKFVRLLPGEGFSVKYTIGFDHPLLRHQTRTFKVTSESFADEIAPARTFGFMREVEALRRAGLALGGSLENAVVIGESGFLNKLRFEDEFVRHKMLDAIGDLALVGRPIAGHLEALRAGHALHAALAHKLLQTPEAWALVTQPHQPHLEIGPQPSLAAQSSTA
ncbi:MAG: UDP-3-O-acyl-N-acetylglucosamine deacetylase [Vicinamibacteria bacterium]|nr:UDP-3-O-acyl-N-acetylglucosamine deacetylase [Vicinamibacteria bacterium]